MIFIIILIIVAIIFLRFWLVYRKRYRFDCVSLVVGAPKTGKTTLQVHLALKDYKKRVLRWKLKRLLRPKNTNIWKNRCCIQMFPLRFRM